jgi:hypothetical protein
MGIYIKLYSKVICVCAMGLVLGIESCYTYNGCHSLLLSLGGITMVMLEVKESLGNPCLGNQLCIDNTRNKYT